MWPLRQQNRGLMEIKNKKYTPNYLIGMNTNISAVISLQAFTAGVMSIKIKVFWAIKPYSIDRSFCKHFNCSCNQNIWEKT